MLVLAACSGGLGDEVGDIVETVALQRGGTVSALRDRRGSGPFTRYEVPPDVLLEAVEAAAHRACGRGCCPVEAVFASRRRGEVVAKERSGEDAKDDSYNAPFDSAMLAAIHPVRDEPDASLLEIHECAGGAFETGAVSWRQDMPGWIAAELAARGRPATSRPATLP